ncbi:MAG: MjaI family restriction endonuclease [Candidatus Marinimicrobia bacterium]|nr:MjaI family restriction endonuclease [Candidatus Neomarinimicrobiota bacterium]MBL7010673.1 MjaI family restriction endonuclease [Candidatus Neomarinimicrobiota bacterium]MBL7031130.1 MjaI family restriction endonuclease [Candidatus Neomarinimicrobiota bacterium]
MDLFQLPINKNLFKQTNALWNDLMLNAPWSVGYVSTLIENKSFPAKEDWEAYYYQSGSERDQLLNSLSPNHQKLLNDEQRIRTDKNAITELSSELLEINTQYGRTKKQLAFKGKILFQGAVKCKISITEKECVEAVRFRIICQTWNGIIIREKNTIKKMTEIFPGCTFDKTDGKFDHQYAVDYLMYRNKVLICGIQIKPQSYMSKAPYVSKAKNANERKNSKFKEKYDRPVWDIISKSNGCILNKQILKKIKLFI